MSLGVWDELCPEAFICFCPRPLSEMALGFALSLSQPSHSPPDFVYLRAIGHRFDGPVSLSCHTLNAVSEFANPNT